MTSGPRFGAGHSTDVDDVALTCLTLPLLCSLKTGSFGTGVFRDNVPWLGGAEDDEGIEVFGRAEGVYPEAGSRRDSGR